MHLRVDDRFNPSLRMNSIILYVENHPVLLSVCAFGDVAGQVVLLDFVKGHVLNVFWLTATHLCYPHLEMGVSGGCFSPDGSLLFIGTDYGSIQVYGSCLKEIYAMTPNEQFFRAEDEPAQQIGAPTSPTRREVNGLLRRPLCNANRDPYSSVLENDLTVLLAEGFLSPP